MYTTVCFHNAWNIYIYIWRYKYIYIYIYIFMRTLIMRKQSSVMEATVRIVTQLALLGQTGVTPQTMFSSNIKLHTIGVLVNEEYCYYTKKYECRLRSQIKINIKFQGLILYLNNVPYFSLFKFISISVH